MTTWAQIIGGFAINVITGDDLSYELAHRFVPGYDGGHPGIEWNVVPDGTESGASSNGDGAFTNPPAIPKAPQQLSKLEFISLCETAGGMTDANFASALSALPTLWAKLSIADYVERDNPLTTGALATLAGAGYLPNGAVAVTAAWPCS